MTKLDEMSNAQLIVALEHTIADLFDVETPTTLAEAANKYVLFLAELTCRLGVTDEELDKAYKEAE